MRSSGILAAAVALGALAAAHPASAQAPDYIALGDSYAYGFTTIGDLISNIQTYETNPGPTNPAFPALTGYQGYVAPFSQFLGLPETSVYNLAVTGETSSSFFSYNSESLANLNYALAPGDSQAQLFSTTLANLGGSVEDITVQLGGNDLIGLAESPQFAAAADPTKPGTLSTGQSTLVGLALASFNTTYTGLLTQLRASSPNVFAIGYFDPFTPLDTMPASGVTDPFGGLGAVLLPELNSAIQADAAAAGVKYVDISSAFAGKEEALSEDTQPFDDSALSAIIPGYTSSLPATFPDYHPNPAGYAVIAQQLDKAAVPEPGSLSLLLLGLPIAGLAVRRRRRG